MLLNNLNNPACHAAYRANIKEAGRFGEQIQHSKEVAKTKQSQQGDFEIRLEKTH